MLLSYRHRFLFVHIAKTGGTSIRAALRRYRWGWPYSVPLGICSLMSQATRPRHVLGIKFPRHAKAVAAKEMLPTDFYDSLFKFTVVRNPWDLQVSSFHHLKREHPDLVAEIPDFSTFIRAKFDPQRPYNFLLDISREQQWEYVSDVNGERIVDFIARYETLAEDYRTICERIGIDPPGLPHHRRAGDRTHYRSYYDDALREIVGNHYARDVELFGYDF